MALGGQVTTLCSTHCDMFVCLCVIGTDRSRITSVQTS